MPIQQSSRERTRWTDTGVEHGSAGEVVALDGVALVTDEFEVLLLLSFSTARCNGGMSVAGSCASAINPAMCAPQLCPINTNFDFSFNPYPRLTDGEERNSNAAKTSLVCAGWIGRDEEEVVDWSFF